MDDEINYYVAFSHFYGIGPVRFTALINKYGSAQKAYRVPEIEIKKLFGTHIGEKFSDFKRHFDPRKKVKEIQKEGIAIITKFDRNYPTQLLNIPDPPICLYVKGDYSLFNFKKDYFFGIVGTRKPTPYGQQIAQKFSHDLATAGFIIVSGMAMGIDTVAHEAALNAEGKTIAFLGCGVDIVYPAINISLYERMVKGGGVVISEFPPGEMVRPGLFIARNRLISGLSMGVLVAEGAEDSGALITARFAAEQGKSVFAPPSPITSEMSAAPNSLLKQGAKLVTTVSDIFEEFNLKMVPKTKEDLRKQLVGAELLIFDKLIVEPRLADELAELHQCPVGEILNTLSLMEIKGVVEKNSQGKYQLRLQ